ncbi:hypothetical protein NZK27_06090 [Synechococcus sp. FGCU-3]|nr:hypothetical protein [Synechococcus sp. FGCU3]
MRWSWVVAMGLLALAGCGKPDVTALQRMACEQAGANVDLQSVQQLDALRKALGIAPDVDPLTFCQSIGAKMTPAPSAEQEPTAEAEN